MKKFIFVVYKDDKIIGEVTSHAPSLEEAETEVNDLFTGYGVEFDYILLNKIEED